MVKRSITIAGHRTSISLEEPFWQALTEIAEAKDQNLPGLVAEIDKSRAGKSSLSAALRIYALDWHRAPGRKS